MLTTVCVFCMVYLSCGVLCLADGGGEGVLEGVAAPPRGRWCSVGA